MSLFSIDNNNAEFEPYMSLFSIDNNMQSSSFICHYLVLTITIGVRAYMSLFSVDNNNAEFELICHYLVLTITMQSLSLYVTI